MKKNQNGSFTIEASIIVPMILMIFVAIVYVVFYYHDKNILTGAAYETAVVASERGLYKEEEIVAFFQKRIRGKLIIFSDVQEQIKFEENKVTIQYQTQRKGMKIKNQVSAIRTEPEKYIRNVRKIKKQIED